MVLRPEDADGVNNVFDEFFSDVRLPPLRERAD
ncbi:hypothetical protein HNR40_007776 [Nonomuraea endophytica]|uniref:Uncharacterized protein n=1 Tax=Nonomuraea endophytica TaxID=714136 RepID=A0A7W8ABX5_9ACTN|nr:hypothetical protein [Nonomuraea endophytica]